MTPPILAEQRLSRTSPAFPPARAGSGRLPKADPDVADLLGVNALADHASPPVSLTSSSEDAGDVLNDLVEDHLQRATDASPNPVALPPDDGGRVDLLREEIDALLAEPAESAAPTTEHEDENVEILPTPSGAVSEDELAILLPQTGPELDAGANGAAETFQGAADVAAELNSDETAIEAADEELAARVATLREDQQAAIRPDRRGVEAQGESTSRETLEALPVPEREAAPVLEAHPLPEIPVDAVSASVAAPPIPVVILQPDEEEEPVIAAPRRRIIPRIKAAVSEGALMIAQLLDLPFSWLDGLDKYLLGIAAIVFFLSGCVLMLLGWYMKVH